jgi:ankyrin repeat protein
MLLNKVPMLIARMKRDTPPLIIVCYNNQPEAAKLLLDNDVNAADFGGNTALMGAAFKGYADNLKRISRTYKPVIQGKSG